MTKKIFLISLILFLSLCFTIFKVNALNIEVESDKVDAINKQIDDYKEKIKKFKNEEDIYEDKISKAREDVQTLENEVYILKIQIAQKQKQVQLKETEIESKNFIIENIQKQILNKEKELKEKKSELGKLIQVLNFYDNKKPLGILFLESSLSDVFNQFRYLISIHNKINTSANKLNEIKEDLNDHEEILRKELANLIEIEKDLKKSKISLEKQKNTKEILLSETQGIEWRFQSLLANVIKERQSMEQEIISLEDQARKEISNKKEKIAQRLMEEEGRVIFSWPVPNTTITSTFHDPNYPFRSWLGEHSAIDIRAKQGTPIRAPAAGYIARAKHGGMGYSYIMIIHNDEFSTIYGHVSEILVEEREYIKRGDLIGKSGGMPGTPGAGRFSTGPHLHFGVRLNGVPVNPEDYLL